MNRKLFAMALTGAALALGACGDDDGGNEKAGDTGNPEETPTQATPAPNQGSEGGGSGTDEREEGSGGAAATLKADADPGGELKFTTESLEGKAGTITLTMANPSDLPHAIGVKGSGVDEEGETVDKGGTSQVTVELKPGEYEFYCPVPGHEEGGMKGTLTVK
jgi:plastocyanin